MKKYIVGIVIGCAMTLSIPAMANVTQWVASKATFPVFVNGQEFVTDKPVVAIDGSTYLSLKAVGEALDVKVVWNDELKRVEIGETVEVVTETDNIQSDKTISQKNAVRKAKSYLDYSAFSRDGLITQLEYEGFTTEDATYGADNCGADWMEQAAKKAKSYLNYSAFSRDGLITQLEYEGFTTEQAIYGVDSTGL